MNVFEPTEPHATLCVIANDIFEPELLNSGGHRHFLHCIPHWSTSYRVTIQAPLYAHTGIRRYLPNARLVATPFGSCVRKKGIFATVLRCLGASFVPASDVYYAASPLLPNLIGPAIRRLMAPKTRFVAIIHHLIERENRKLARSSRLLPMISEQLSLGVLKWWATHILFVSTAVRDVLVEKHFNGSILTKTSNAISNRALKFGNGERIREANVIYLGNLSRRKGTLDLLEAWRAVNERWPSATLMLVGQIDRNEQAMIEDAARRFTKSVQFFQNLSDEQVSDLLARAQVFVTPSYEEGWGIAAAEAMAAGVPVITYDLPAYEPVLGDARLIVPVGDRERLSDAIITLLADAGLRARLAIAGKAIAGAFSWDRVAETEAASFRSEG